MTTRFPATTEAWGFPASPATTPEQATSQRAGADPTPPIATTTMSTVETPANVCSDDATPFTDSASPLPDIHVGRPLWNRSFAALLVTQFFSATNDNIVRWLVVPIGKELAVGHEGVALSAGLACFVLPYLLLAAPAGYLADRFSKRNVIVACKTAEIVIMLLGIASILAGHLYLMFAVVFLMGTHSALFSPSKLGSIPEIVHPRTLSAANGWMSMVTVIAIVVGAAVGNFLYECTKPAGTYHWGISAATLLGVAVIGLLASLHIKRLVPANPARTFPRNFVWQVVRDQRFLFSHRALFLAALGTTFFWSLAALVQLNIDTFGTRELGVTQDMIGPLLGILMVGVGFGSVLAGRWSRGRVELGIVPLGAATIVVGSLFLFGMPLIMGSLFQLGATGVVAHWFHAAYGLTCLGLFALGAGAGLFVVPLESFLQERSPDRSRGVVLAAANFLTFAGMFASSGIFWLLDVHLALSARQIFLVFGLTTFVVLFVILWLLPVPTVRFLVGLVSRLIYRVKIQGVENVPAHGGALLVANHITWIDGFLLLISAPRRIRMVAHADYVTGGFRGWLAKQAGIITLDNSRKSMVRAIREAREALANGELVCIFPEGGLSRTGSLREFRPGFLSILKGTDAPVIPVCLHGLWGSIFSFERGKFFWKWPRHWPYPVSILFGTPAAGVATAYEARQMVAQLESQAMQADKALDMIPARYFLRNCRRHMRQGKVADSTGVRLTSADVLIRALILRRLLLRDILDADERQIGLLMPPTAAGAVANIAVPLAGRVPVNLNYSIRSPEVLNACLAQAGIRHVLTSRKVMEKLDLSLDAQIVYLEDLASRIRWTDKLRAALAAWCLPVRVLERVLGLNKIDPNDLATIIFTSGSTGVPKGVMLTHRNIASNVIAFTRFFRIDRDDILIGILPFFHAFGYTVTLWAPLMLEPMGVYHYSPLEARQIGQLCKKHGATILVATPTFARSYLRRVEPEDFASLNLIVLGAEKMAVELADGLESRFGVRPIEGYGATELSPVVCGNVPSSRLGRTDQVARKEGSAGKPLPGISAKVVDLDTGEDLGPNRSGMLLVTGPNVMKGYLHSPEKTAEVMRDGWYVTGDVASIDEDGFIFITGRLSRFAKIGGEMVPHLGVEEAILRVLGLDEEETRVVVTSVPDAKKGERLVVLHTGLPKTPDEISRALGEAGLPPIWIPSPDSFRQVPEIPILGSGKLALRDANELARRLFGVA